MSNDECVYARLSPCSLGLSLGVLKGLFLLLLAYAGWLGGYGLVIIEHASVYYHGYSASLVGGLVGAAYGVVYGFVFGYLFGFFYNYFMRRCAKCKS